jgi:hypothetical protein
MATRLFKKVRDRPPGLGRPDTVRGVAGDVEVPEPSAWHRTDYAVTADGQRFLVNTVVDQLTRPALTVFLYRTPELKK